MQKYINKLRDFNELVMFEHSIFSLPFIFIAMVVAADGWFGFVLLILGVFAAISARNFAMGLNRFADRDIDAQNPRTLSRPSVDGRLDANSILIFTILNASVFIAVAYIINPFAFYLSFPILVIIGSYSYFKRFSSLAHIVLGISLGLAPIAGVVAVSAEITPWSVMLSLGVIFWVAGFDLLYSLQDIDFDKERGLHSIPSKYGSEATLKISAFFHMLSVIFWALFVWVAGLNLFAYIAVILSAFMLGYEHYLVRKDFTKIDRAFFTVNGYLGIVFFILIVLDKVIL
ncbi:MAG: 4-hydroxybenzoate polyprenyltransferase [Sulfurimonas sp. RIFCSPHIGHO2_12_FULL_36_9]|uniref:menaquinone biosynthesis prenyltransferase MqnP n=1 Tax=Sulfurimonas sp. RIFCSPLOWO2_12_36_12 TaxID=1802253 RepID=UPI0008CBDAF9|nr:menaquinone biosynthesis prenyltransferase MqnP [Sulfurimonas sp. RIFCSPLOWO2_12_36_12]OHD96401.1 MAG: 4-hydroxybenzoate polyprenyltransferase [Sulfurimonas sp. RIFCSPHIGHO2_12_FULL_36_9]OHD99015.1 MAG: 4-hydroxybenzoate polyprenyltransferase [Sulfurimonas sp. RIFCSPLOWO2_02_FULL_36_28]OHE01284.1 MAG: 4-hydroxybenzoate polyprenyltransferase [Sulfurimonas sp. RIFCSPLOWO2_12_36_12]